MRDKRGKRHRPLGHHRYGAKSANKCFRQQRPSGASQARKGTQPGAATCFSRLGARKVAPLKFLKVGAFLDFLLHIALTAQATNGLDVHSKRRAR
jgi:hypothetical protein